MTEDVASPVRVTTIHTCVSALVPLVTHPVGRKVDAPVSRAAIPSA